MVRANSKLYSFANAPSEIPLQITARITNILLSPQISRFNVTYKVYRRQAEKLSILQLSEEPAMVYVLSKSGVYSLTSEFETIVLKLNTWTLRQTMRIDGTVHDVERISNGRVETRRIKTGVISQGPSSKGIVIDIQESQTSESIGKEHEVLDEIMGPMQQALLANADKTGVTIQISNGQSLSESETAQTALAYFELFSKF